MRATLVSENVMAGASAALIEALEALFGQKLAALAIGRNQPVRPETLGDLDRVCRLPPRMRLQERLKGVPLFVVELDLLDHGFSALS